MATELPPGTTIPPDGTLPEGITLPPGLSLPPGVTIPPALLDGSFNGTVTEAAEGFLNGGNDIFGNNAGPLEADFDFTRAVNATPYFNAEKLVEYEKNPSTAAMAGVPRFSHTSDFSYLAYVGTQDRHQDGQDYIAGLMFTGLFLLVFFLIWACVLIVFKMRLNGFLSGQPFLNPWLDDPSEQKRKRELEEDGEVYIEDPNWKKQPFRVRVTFFIAGLLNIVFAMLMVTKVTANLQQTTDTVQMSTSNLDLILNAAVSTVDNVKEAGITGEKIRAQVVVDLDRNEFCPDNPLFAQTPQGQNLFNATDGVIEAMQQMGAFIDDDTAGLEEGLEDAKKQLTNVDDYIINIEENEWLGEFLKKRLRSYGNERSDDVKSSQHTAHKSVLCPFNAAYITGGLIAFPYLILSALMMAGALAAQLNTMTDCFLCVLNWVILPLFMFVTFATFIFLVLISFAASMNADFCGGENSTPDKVIMDFMFRSGEDPEGFLYQIVRYYANQCTENAQTDPFVFLRGFSGSLVSNSWLHILHRY